MMPANPGSDTNRPLVCMLVHNSVSRDARVLKSASSLAENDLRVRILGISESPHSLQSERLTSGVEISRLPYRRVRGAATAAKRLLTVLLFLLVALMALVAVHRAAPGAVPVHLPKSTGTWLSIAVALAAGVLALIAVASRKSASSWPPARLLREYRRQFSAYRLAKAHSRPVHEWLAQLEQLQPKVVHCHDMATLMTGVAHKKRFPLIKLVFDAHEIYGETVEATPYLASTYRRLLGEHGASIDAFITINDSIALHYRQKFPVLPAATVVRNAAMPSQPESYDGRLHALAKLGREQKILLFQGGLTRHRGIESLLSCASGFPDDWSLVFMGWGPLEADIRQFMTASKHTVRKWPSVCLVPPAPQSELARWTQGATIGLIPYDDFSLNHRYCTPNKLWEYPNARVPALVSPRVEMKKLIEEYGFGWVLVEPLTASWLGNFLGSLPQSALKEAQRACVHFIECSNWRYEEQHLLGFYRDLLAQRARESAGA